MTDYHHKPDASAAESWRSYHPDAGAAAGFIVLGCFTMVVLGVAALGVALFRRRYRIVLRRAQ